MKGEGEEGRGWDEGSEGMMVEGRKGNGGERNRTEGLGMKFN